MQTDSSWSAACTLKRTHRQWHGKTRTRSLPDSSEQAEHCRATNLAKRLQYSGGLAWRVSGISFCLFTLLPEVVSTCAEPQGEWRLDYVRSVPLARKNSSVPDDLNECFDKVLYVFILTLHNSLIDYVPHWTHFTETEFSSPGINWHHYTLLRCSIFIEYLFFSIYISYTNWRFGLCCCNAISPL